ncbi:MAG: ribonuclease P [Desulfurococcales archaeon]|nr:ribonuclease P [Desulfurococcales archaeon]
MRRRRNKLKRTYQDIVRQRQSYLLKIAEAAAKSGDLEYAARLGRYIKQLSMKTGVRLQRRIKRSLCKNCGLPLIPGVTARVRLKTQGGFSYVVITCKRCGWIHRYPYRKGRSYEREGGIAEEEGADGAP